MSKSELQRLVEVMDRLRSPGGCPWDAEQTHESLVKYLLEESYEYIDTVDSGDREGMREELGDVLLQVYFHSRIAEDHPTDPFSIEDVARAIADKLIRRHPHVFEDLQVSGMEEVIDKSITNLDKYIVNIILPKANPEIESLLKEKATTLIEVLGRRKEIEDYLTKLEVTRKEEDKIIISDEKPAQKTVVAAPVAVTPVKVAPTIKTITPRDTTAVKPVLVKAGFSIQPELKHYVVMLLNKVDGVYINEAKNAFVRFNKESYLTQNLVINKDVLDAERSLLVFATFDDAEAAIKYYDKIKKAAPKEVSWLQANKYSFLIISESNLQLLKTNKDIDGYRQMLNVTFGNKF